MSGYVWLCRVMYGYVGNAGLCMAMWGCVWLFMAMYGYAGVCRAM